MTVRYELPLLYVPYPTFSKIKKFFSQHPNRGELKHYASITPDKITTKDVELEAKLDLHLMSSESGGWQIFVSLVNGNVYDYAPYNVLRSDSHLHSVGHYDKWAAEQRARDKQSLEDDDGTPFFPGGVFTESFYTENPTFKLAAPRLASVKGRNLPADLSDTEKAFAAQNDFRALQSDEYSGIYVSLRDGTTYTFRSDSVGEPGTTCRFRPVGHYDEFVSKYCNNAQRGMELEEQLTELCLF
jgi:hypothetical protein